MGIEVRGGMIIGCNAEIVYEQLKVDLYDFMEEHEMSIYTEHYDADYSSSVIGFVVDDVKIDNDFHIFVSKVMNLADKFKELTGCDAMLIGMQDVF